MNYNTWTFWALFGIIILPYWWLKHRQQNRLLLVASYLFYGFWDYRFLFLILVSTVIDYIGGLGVAGVMLPKRRLRNLGALLMGSSLLLCSNVRYGDLWQGVHAADLPKILTALPHRLSDGSARTTLAGISRSRPRICLRSSSSRAWSSRSPRASSWSTIRRAIASTASRTVI